jgi:aryl-alcohol dehydrogenase-like predicted oxidoreductase
MKLAIGTAQFGSKYGITNQHGKVEFHKAKEILNLANEYSIDTLDTAYDYKGAHDLIGSLQVKNFNIISKLPKLTQNDNIYKNIKIKINEILKSLKINQLNGLLIHDTKQLYAKNGYLFWDALKKIKDEGYVKNIGYSLYDVNELEGLFYKYRPDIVQIPCNIFDQRFLKSGWVQKLSDENVFIYIRSVFLQGLLLLEPQNLPKSFLKWKPLWNKWYNWLEVNDLSPLEGCMNLFLKDDRVHKIIVGIENSAQLNEILKIEPLEINYPKWMSVNDTALLNPSLWKNLK